MVSISISDRICFITLNRPEKRNALSGALVQELHEALVGAEANSLVKVIVLKANGSVFSAGADLDYLQQLQQNTFDENLADSTKLGNLFRSIYSNQKIVIAQVEGSAIAGGCGLATVCDFTFAVPEASFGYTEVKIGFIPAIVMVFLLRKVGEAKAKELLLTGKLITAAKALEMGLINEVVAKEFIESTVLEFATKLCYEASANSLELTKRMMNEVQNMSWEAGVQYAAEMNATARASEDCKRGIASFLNKQKIVW